MFATIVRPHRNRLIMTRQLPTATASDMYAHWFTKTWSDLEKRYSTPDDLWSRILRHSLSLDQLQEVLRHKPPIKHVATFFCYCTDVYEKEHLLAQCILDTCASELMAELNNPEHKAQYAAQSGLGKNDPMLAWDVWNSHSALWKRYIALDPVVFDPQRTVEQVKVLKLDGLPALADVLPKIQLSVKQIKDIVAIMCADLYTSQEKLFNSKTTNYLKRCVKALVNKLPTNEREILLQTPPYKNGAWDNILTKNVLTKQPPALKTQKDVASEPICTVEEAQLLRNRRLTRTSVVQILSSGLDVEWQNRNEMTLLQQVVSEGLVTVLPLVLTHNPNIHVRTRNEKTSVCHMAANLPDARALTILLDNGANPWLQDAYAQTPLQIAIRKLNVKAVECLIQSPGFDPSSSEHALHLAQANVDVPQWDIKVIDVFNILVRSNTNLGWKSKEYPSFVEVLSKRRPYQYDHIVPTLKNAMDNLAIYKQAIAIEQHIASPHTPQKTRKM